MAPDKQAGEADEQALVDLELTLARMGRVLRRIRIPSKYLNRDIDINSFWQLAPLRANKVLRPTEIASQLGLDNSTISRQLQKLEAQGLIEREVDPSDARAQLVKLTTDGEQILSLVASARREMIAGVISNWNDEDVSSLIRFLNRFSEELEAEL